MYYVKYIVHCRYLLYIELSEAHATCFFEFLFPRLSEGDIAGIRRGSAQCTASVHITLYREQMLNYRIVIVPERLKSMLCLVFLMELHRRSLG